MLLLLIAFLQHYSLVSSRLRSLFYNTILWSRADSDRFSTALFSGIEQTQIAFLQHYSLVSSRLRSLFYSTILWSRADSDRFSTALFSGLEQTHCVHVACEFSMCDSVQGHHTIDSLEDRGVERGSARQTSLKGRERAIVNQTNIGTVSKVTLGTFLRDGMERILFFLLFFERIDTV